MFNVFNFYYDECGHTRVITEKAINDDQFFIYFASAIIGWKQSFEENFFVKYSKFEEKYKRFYCVDELKSNVIRTKKYLYGLSSMNDSDIDFLNEYCDLILNDDVFIYFSFLNKLNLLIAKGVFTIKDERINVAQLAYSISKLIEVYRPQNVIHALYSNDIDNFKSELRSFLNEKYNENKNIIGKETENYAVLSILLLIDEIKLPRNCNFFYEAIFAGFYDFLDEVGINQLILMIDKEGSGKTLLSASKFFDECSETDSKESFGIRCADLCAGLFGRILNSMVKTFHPKNEKVVPLKRLLPLEWFDFDEKRFLLYKKLKKIFIDKNNVYDKVFSTIYSDDLLYLICFLNCIDSFDTFEEYKEKDFNLLREYLNTYVNESLANRFDMLGFNE